MKRLSRLLRRAVSHDSAQIAVTRIAAMGLGFVINLIATHLIITRDGVGAFATFSIIVSLLAALPFADMGLGVGIVNATSDHASRRLDTRAYLSVLRGTLQLLLGVTVLIVAVDVSLLITGAWGNLLGGEGANSVGIAAATLVIGLLAVSVPLGMGQRILQGRSKLLAATRLGLLTTGLQAALLASVYVSSVPAIIYSVAPAVALVVTSTALTIYALRVVGIRPRRLVTRTLVRLPGDYSFAATSLPFLGLTLLNAAGTQFDRVLLAQVSDDQAVAQYSFLMQFVVAVMSIVALTSSRLWPIYREAAGRGQLRRDRLRKDTLSHAGGGVVISAVVVLAVVTLVGPVTEYKLAAEPVSLVAASALIVVWSASRPATMVLQNARGLRVQLIWAIPAAVLNVTGSLALGSLFGAAGPITASVTALALFGSIPIYLSAQRQVAPKQQSAAQASDVGNPAREAV